MSSLSVISDGQVYGTLTAEPFVEKRVTAARPASYGYMSYSYSSYNPTVTRTVFPYAWDSPNESSVPGAYPEDALAVLRIQLPPEEKSASLHFHFTPLAGPQDLMYSVFTDKTQKTTPYVHYRHSPTNPLLMNKTFRSMSEAGTLVVSREKDLKNSKTVLTSDGSAVRADRPETFGGGVYQIYFGIEKEGEDAKLLMRSLEDGARVLEMEEVLDTLKEESRQLTAQIESFQGRTEVWRQCIQAYHDEFADAHLASLRLQILDGVRSYYSSIRGLFVKPLPSNHPPAKLNFFQKESEEESAGGAGGLFDDDDDDYGWGPSATASTSLPTKSGNKKKGFAKEATRANLHSKSMTCHSRAVSTDHLTHCFQFSLVVELVESVTDAPACPFPASDLGEMIVKERKEVARLEKEIREATTKRDANKRALESQVTMTKDHYKSVWSRLASHWTDIYLQHCMSEVHAGFVSQLDPLYSVFHFEDRPLVHEALATAENRADAPSEYPFPEDLVRASIPPFDRANFYRALLDEEATLRETVGRISSPTKVSAHPVRHQKACAESFEESAGGAGGLFDDDDDDW